MRFVSPVAWCMRLSQVQAMEMAELCERTGRDWYGYCRETCCKDLLKASQHSVQVEVSRTKSSTRRGLNPESTECYNPV
ncbi:hypothetical protein L914_09102 [Phytophthora nicotianae]|nr:hypothetical protein L914_09102 [Phytophthora nicotianae]